MGIAYIGVSGVLAAQHANTWRTEDGITRVTVEHTPMSARGHVWRTLALGRARGDSKIMEAHARRAVSIVPQWGKPHALIASSLDEQGRPREALSEFLRAMELAPYDDDVADLFIQFLMHYGHIEQARDIYLRHARARGGVPAHNVTAPPSLDQEPETSP